MREYGAHYKVASSKPPLNQIGMYVITFDNKLRRTKFWGNK